MAEQATQRRDDSAIDMAAVVSSLASEACQELPLPSECCIFRTPHILLRHHKTGYAPNAFPIGPYHHTNPKLHPARKIKLRYLNDLMKRVRGYEDPLSRCADKIRDIAGIARQYYSDGINMATDEFAKMLLLDGCFIVELFLKEPEASREAEDDDTIPTMACMIQYLYQDLILMENQIPWLVLERVFKEITKSDDVSALIQRTLEFFGNINSFSSSGAQIDSSLFNGIRIRHILDLLRISLILPLGGEIIQLTDTAGDGTEWQLIPTATTLQNSGITIRRVTSGSILDMRFRKGILEIPSLVVHERTETIFKNLISFEQCDSKCPPYVTCYAMLMDNLINTREDMDVLSERGILDNRLTPDDATRFFSKLYHDAFVRKFYYQKLCKDVNAYRCHLWPRWRAHFMNNYLVKPWAAVSLSVALVLLVLTFLQTLYSILSYKSH